MYLGTRTKTSQLRHHRIGKTEENVSPQGFSVEYLLCWCAICFSCHCTLRKFNNHLLSLLLPNTEAVLRGIINHQGSVAAGVIALD